MTHRFPGVWTGDPAVTLKSAPTKGATLSACSALAVILKKNDKFVKELTSGKSLRERGELKRKIDECVLRRA